MDKTVIVFSMQKSGSTTIMRALQSTGYDAHRGYAENIRDLPWRECPIVVPFRDPFEHAMSWLWERWLMESNNLDPRNVPVLDKLGYFPAIFWFDTQFESLFGFNPIDEPIDVSPGDILFIRTDKISDELAKGLSHLLGVGLSVMERRELVPDFDVVHRARGVERFGAEYEHFQKHVKVKSKIAHMVIDSAYVKAFWTDEEQKEMTKRWIK